jgi:hypothetical protein
MGRTGEILASLGKEKPPNPEGTPPLSPRHSFFIDAIKFPRHRFTCLLCLSSNAK